jgi:protein AroM
MKLAALTIGQSPRTDIMEDIKGIFAKDTKIIEKGALDGLSRKEINSLHPKENDYILISRLNDGTAAKISGRYVEKRLQNIIKEIENETDMFLILCAGQFPTLTSKKLIIKPDILFSNFIPGIIQRGVMVDLVPLEEQIDELKTRWNFNKNIKVKYKSLCPYTATRGEIISKAREIKDMKPDLVLLDCFGFGTDTKEIFKEVVNKPIILVRTFDAYILKELLD